MSCPVPPHHTTAACYLLHCCLLPAACYLLPATCCWMLQTTCCLLLLFAASPDARCCCLRCRLPPPPPSPTRSSLFPFPTSESQFLSARCGGPATRRGQAGRLRPSPGESPSLRRRRYSKTRCWNQRRRQDQSSSPQAPNRRETTHHCCGATTAAPTDEDEAPKCQSPVITALTLSAHDEDIGLGLAGPATRQGQTVIFLLWTLRSA